MIRVEVVYASTEKQVVISLKVMPNATIEEAIIASGILQQFPEIELIKAKVGIYSRPASLETRLKENDRVEIYRPLLIDPKQARKNRAKTSKI